MKLIPNTLTLPWWLCRIIYRKHPGFIQVAAAIAEAEEVVKDTDDILRLQERGYIAPELAFQMIAQNTLKMTAARARMHWTKS